MKTLKLLEKSLQTLEELWSCDEIIDKKGNLISNEERFIDNNILDLMTEIEAHLIEKGIRPNIYKNN
jgi:hypothetical protein